VRGSWERAKGVVAGVPGGVCCACAGKGGGAAVKEPRLQAAAALCLRS